MGAVPAPSHSPQHAYAEAVAPEAPPALRPSSQGSTRDRQQGLVPTQQEQATAEQSRLIQQARQQQPQLLLQQFRDQQAATQVGSAHQALQEQAAGQEMLREQAAQQARTAREQRHLEQAAQQNIVLEQQQQQQQQQQQLEALRQQQLQAQQRREQDALQRQQQHQQERQQRQQREEQARAQKLQQEEAAQERARAQEAQQQLEQRQQQQQALLQLTYQEQAQQLQKAQEQQAAREKEQQEGGQGAGGVQRRLQQLAAQQRQQEVLQQQAALLAEVRAQQQAALQQQAAAELQQQQVRAAVQQQEEAMLAQERALQREAAARQQAEEQQAASLQRGLAQQRQRRQQEQWQQQQESEEAAKAEAQLPAAELARQRALHAQSHANLQQQRQLQQLAEAELQHQRLLQQLAELELQEQRLMQQQQREQWQQEAMQRRQQAAEAATQLAEPAPRRRQGSSAPAGGRGSKGGRPLRLVFVAAEVAPWSKTGGLGDVMGALPAALAARGHSVMVVAPRYLDGHNDALYNPATPAATAVGIDLWEGGYHSVDLLHQRAAGVDHVWVDHPSFHRAGCTPYGPSGGAPFDDNLFRFCLLSMAACEAPLLVNCLRHPNGSVTPYGEDVTFIASDWHTALVPIYLQARMRPYGVYGGAACVLMLHNLAHQGQHPPKAYPALGVPGGLFPTFEWITPRAEGEGGQLMEQSINVLKAGVMTADLLVTVSQGYALEITAPSPEGGGVLHGLVRGRRGALRGITNGIDLEEWDPLQDPHIAPCHFGPGNMRGKAALKAGLQREMGLPLRPEVPLLLFVGRLDFQKGPDIVMDALPRLAALDCQVVMLGAGAPDYEERVRGAESQYPEYFRGVVGFRGGLAHRLMGGGDMLLMPSRFEPCGLTQLYAMRYGTLPVAHATGGLKDTVEEYCPFAPDDDPNLGTGWTFSPCTPAALVRAVETAVAVYRDAPARWAALQARAMARDSGWASSAAQYEALLMGLQPEVVAGGASGGAKQAKALAAASARVT